MRRRGAIGTARQRVLAGAMTAATGLLALAPGASAWSGWEFDTSGPLSRVFLGNTLDCQVQHIGDSHPLFAQFTGQTNPGSCGTFVVLNGTLFGPSVPFGPQVSAFTPVSQTGAGSGTAQDPLVATTVVSATLPGDSVPSARITETDSYVAGQEVYGSTVRLENMTRAPLGASLYHAGDCFLTNAGYGFFDPSTGGVFCAITPGNSPPARIEGFVPLTAGSSFQEDVFSTVYAGMNGAPFSNTVDSTHSINNAAGIAWAGLGVPSGGSVTEQLYTRFAPTSTPVSSAAIPACSRSGSIPVTVSAANGAANLHFKIDGVENVVATGPSGQANVQVPAGSHVLEYWGEDQAGQLEAHHLEPVVVEPSGPTVTITSDQGQTDYAPGDVASVSIVAAGLGLVSDPSQANVAVPTDTSGTFAVSRTATDACGSNTGTLTYNVLAPPSLGETVTVEAVAGRVLISPGKGAAFVPLTRARNVSVGSVLDTSHGTARLQSATSRPGQYYRGQFSAGIFSVLQDRRLAGLTDLRIQDASGTRACRRAGKAQAARGISKRVLGLLSGNANGRFRTRGRYSAATVRGTEWSVTDRCDGTLTHVKIGVVIVRDFRRGRNVTLHAGRSYLAKPR